MPSHPKTHCIHVRRRALRHADGQPQCSGPRRFPRRYVTDAPIASNKRICPFRPATLVPTSMQAWSCGCGGPR